MRIHADDGRSSCYEPISMGSNKGRSVTASQQFRNSDELINAARLRREVPEMMTWPSMRVVILNEREGSRLVGDDPHCDIRFVQVLLINRISGFSICVDPPFPDRRRFQPFVDQWKVVGRRASEIIDRQGPNLSSILHYVRF